jgi:uncharacterized tellurite resistance protein B-like protein
MLDKLRDLMARAEKKADVKHLAEEELKLATSALLVHASVIDGEIDPAEEIKFRQLLQNRFDLSRGEVSELIARGREKERHAVDLYGFTKVICAELDLAGRRRIVEMLWEIVFADGRLDDYESNLVWRVSELLGVSTSERVALRKSVAARYGGEVKPK